MTALPKLYDPVVLKATTTVAANSNGAPNVAALKNPHGLPMELLSVRVDFWAASSDLTDTATYVDGLTLGMKLDLGNIPLMNTGVPVNCLGNIFDAPENVGIRDAVYSKSGQIRFKYPIYIPANATVVPTFTHFGLSPLALNIDVTYYARSLPSSYKPPECVRLPWITAYRSKSFLRANPAPTDTDESSENDLANIFDVELEIAQFAGASQTIGSLSFADPILPFMYTYLKMFTSRGDDIIRTPTIFNSVFPIDWLAWDLRGSLVLQPKDYVKVFLQTNAITSDFSGFGVGPSRTQFAVAMHGYRSVKTKAYQVGG